ncbi:hypothetical protein [Nigerium massiliense]|uniref:hypothetical protein n=1 Tax=Nigerium massiliense TaxID=1522317 RepID=UPI00058AC0A2|nr:hypothetical protein [Nigerium massiliense]
MIYLPAFEADWTMSRWTGRPQGLSIDPIGVECLVPAEVRRGLFGRRKAAEQPAAFLHVLVHEEMPSDRIRSWAARQVALMLALDEQPQLAGDALNRLADDHARDLRGRDWVPATVILDGTPREASVFEAAPDRWAAYLDLGTDRVAIVGRDLALADAPLRTATAEEARQLRTEALKV